MSGPRLVRRLPEGLHLDVPAADYHADPCEAPSLSSGLLRTLITRPPVVAYLEHPRLGGRRRVSTSQMNAGTIAHALLMSGGEPQAVEMRTVEGGGRAASAHVTTYTIGGDEVDVVDAASWSTKAARTARSEAGEAGRSVCRRERWEQAEPRAKAAREFLAEHNDGKHFLSADARSEVTIVWQRFGHWCRARPDRIATLPGARPATIDFEYKFTGKPLGDWRMAQQGNHIQAAWYRYALRAVGHEHVETRLVVQEASYPYLLQLYEPDPLSMDTAELLIGRAFDVWAKCLKEDRWPGYSRRTQVASLRPWELVAGGAGGEADSQEQVEAELDEAIEVST